MKDHISLNLISIVSSSHSKKPLIDVQIACFLQIIWATQTYLNLKIKKKVEKEDNEKKWNKNVLISMMCFQQDGDIWQNLLPNDSS